MTEHKKPLVLMILDGWGYREDEQSNAILAANTPVLDNLWATRPRTLISGSGLDVGLPEGQMGNSEVGHVNLGAGRVVYQDFTRITKAINDGEFDSTPALVENIDKAVAAGKAVHIMGLLSPGGVHSHEDHIVASIQLAAKRGAKEVYFHGFLDGRDTPPRSAKASIERIEALFAELNCGRLASLVGRYYAMDRDNRWNRVEKAYNVMALGEGEFNYADGVSALEAAYERDENDEFVAPTTITPQGTEAAQINDGDTIIFANFRADRAREITRAFVEPGFDGFEKKKSPQLSAFVMMTEYSADIDAPVAFGPTPLVNVLGEWLEKNGKTQLRISETEKYAHVTFFFSGGREDEFEGESRELIPSPQVATYDLQPEMNSEMLTDKLIEAIKSGKFDAIICNYPNGDMVGHSGVFEAAVKACEAVDACIGRVVEALDEFGGEALITADHGNAEQMANTATGQAHTAHTSEPVPFIYVGRDATPSEGKALSDVAPTMLHLMGMEQPSEMTGTPIMTLK
ncbi:MULTISPECIES: 2,3-bisphosphoglycerate-independent phosphoglycerate mutase [Pseudoalteromonas]|jgi:2,3-bisphosphoglycerate-independent phosphoglycerate mutase|uniref:2,3-bisphosphoglycerate-independent phosphoglycerate mutase n=1 Tax=Pseudoalteromonas agarivorans TaxID=176102 RepID=A0AAD0XD63_9GAMM|nr:MULTISPECIES: 2,3-bisphosphoglycerate-independent phosphoglycerate mutase [Pseudoalteromonas]MCP4060317.1 2,3-bisphosphoglycerate-independent phosphoglycerate mutase [Pseudoalteromonas sp.]MDY6888166.1 2,3-bisphosphoglycerate-independent phosphoglycerate mutase [Pseudomonadota bacterium]AYM87762.1 2,3-bisphosphoglycerate-independent phosphoglycerate mutase [Pseudoalteromonas agarivorans]AZN33854.1 2,3-bisphosphoglycerate-independent phosphoglycerate mutase [Pseudoalteromonas sp. Xi13]ENN979|tara:strand:- start:1211 stop:2755 length:1545 start_codon:yes stop_codon:yes gene_type:complete